MTNLIVDYAYGIIPIFFNEEKREFEFLLIQQQGGYWGFPKGHAENSESHLETAYRELREETGYTPEHINIIDGQTFIETHPFEKGGQQYRKENTYYVGMVRKDEVSTQEDFKTEILQTAWFTFDDAVQLLRFKPKEILLRKVFEYLKGR